MWIENNDGMICRGKPGHFCRLGRLSVYYITKCPGMSLTFIEIGFGPLKELFLRLKNNPIFHVRANFLGNM